jgi:hypothetical protein
MDILLEKESTDETGRNRQWWKVESDLFALVSTYLVPTVYVNYKDYDILKLLLVLGLYQYLESKNIKTDLSHGISHLCLKVKKDDVHLFLLNLKTFFQQNKKAIDTSLQDKSKVEDWRDSWWHEYKNKS